MPYGFAAAAIGSVASGLIGADATSKAASQQAQEQQQALDLQRQIFGQTQQNISPYVQSGQNALTQLNQLLGLSGGGGNPAGSNPILKMLGLGGQGTGIDPSTFQGSPGYEYAKQQGLDAVTNAATRGPGGGNALLALQKTGTQLANQNWDQYLSNSSNAWQQMLQNIGGVSSQGLNAASLLSGAGQNFANAAGNNLSAIGNANSAGTIGGANALTGTINNLSKIAGSAGMSNSDWLTSLFGSSGGGGGFNGDNAATALGGYY